MGDLRLGWRQALRLPGYTALSVMTFALGIGLTTTMYAVVEGVLLRPLPFPASDRLVSLERGTGAATSLGRLQAARSITVTADGAALVTQYDFTDRYTLRSDLWTGRGGDWRRLTVGARLSDADVGPAAERVPAEVAAP